MISRDSKGGQKQTKQKNNDVIVMAAFLVILRSSHQCLLEELGVEVVIAIAPMMSSNRLSLCPFSLHRICLAKLL